MIVYNHGDSHIFITTKWHADPLGGPAIKDITFSISPGEGIDLDILQLKEQNPKTKICKICLLELEDNHNCRGYSFRLNRNTQEKK
jgi:hypothetical protein